MFVFWARCVFSVLLNSTWLRQRMKFQVKLTENCFTKMQMALHIEALLHNKIINLLIFRARAISRLNRVLPPDFNVTFPGKGRKAYWHQEPQGHSVCSLPQKIPYSFSIEIDQWQVARKTSSTINGTFLEFRALQPKFKEPFHTPVQFLLLQGL